MEMIYAILQKIYEEHCKTTRLLEVYVRPIGKEITLEPQEVDVAWAHRELHIGRTIFYLWIKDRLLKPVYRRGNSDYYSLAEVRRLYQRHLDERKPYRFLQPLDGEETKMSA